MTYLLSDYGKAVTWKTWRTIGGCGLPNHTNAYKTLGPQACWPDDLTLGDIQQACIVSGRSLARFAVDELCIPVFSQIEHRESWKKPHKPAR